MKNKQILKYIFVTLLIVIVGIFSVTFLANASQSPKTESTAVKVIDAEILAGGSTDAQTKATLNFQMGGKLTYLPLKEGDKVYQGQTIASLDTYSLQQQLQLTANNYQIAKNGTNQATESQQAEVT